MTVLFWHTQGSVLLAIAMLGTLGRDIAQGLFPTATPPPDWLRAVDLIAITAVIVAVTPGKLVAVGTAASAVRGTKLRGQKIRTEPKLDYSQRSAATGSTPIARRAGK